MKCRENNSFTLMEILVVIIIIGIMCTFAIPNYNQMMTIGNMKQINNQFLLLYNAEQLFKAKNGQYFPMAGTPTCPDGPPCSVSSLGDINANLSVSINPNLIYAIYNPSTDDARYIKIYHPSDTFTYITFYPARQLFAGSNPACTCSVPSYCSIMCSN